MHISIYWYCIYHFNSPSIFQLFPPILHWCATHPAPIFFGPPRRHALERAILLRLLRADDHLLRLSSLPGVVLFGHLRALLGLWHIDRWIETEREIYMCVCSQSINDQSVCIYIYIVRWCYKPAYSAGLGSATYAEVELGGQSNGNDEHDHGRWRHVFFYPWCFGTLWLFNVAIGNDHF